MESYNGFSSSQRSANGRALNKAIKARTVSAPSGSCALCGDPNVAPKSLDYHSEDYSKPYVWSPPSAYVLCRHCHRNKLHKRFDNPNQWEAFKAHVRRGGYASELVSDPKVKREVAAFQQALDSRSPEELRVLRSHRPSVETEWWEKLSTKRPE
jgi:hypothetical protein